MSKQIVWFFFIFYGSTFVSTAVGENVCTSTHSPTADADTQTPGENVYAYGASLSYKICEGLHHKGVVS